MSGMSDTNASKPARKPRYGHKPKAFRLTPHDLATLAAVREATGGIEKGIIDNSMMIAHGEWSDDTAGRYYRGSNCL